MRPQARLRRALAGIAAALALLASSAAADCGTWHCPPGEATCYCDHDPIPCADPMTCADHCPAPWGP